MTGPKIYLARMQCEPSFVPQFTKWYINKHTVDLIEAGFLSCQYYHCDVGYPNICNVYEIPGPELFSTDIYQQARKVDEERPDVLSHITDRTNTIYEVLSVLKVDKSKQGALEFPGGDIDAPAVAVVFFDLQGGGENEVLAAASSERTISPRTGGIRRVRLCRFAAKHPNNPRDPRGWIVIAECESGHPYEDVARDIEDCLRNHFQEELANVSLLAGQLRFRRGAV